MTVRVGTSVSREFKFGTMIRPRGGDGCFELTLTHAVILEGEPLWRTPSLPGEPMGNVNIGRWLPTVDSLTCLNKYSAHNIVLLFG